jgi:hypothetical protein
MFQESSGPDGLSRRPAQPGDMPEEDDKEEFDDWIDKHFTASRILSIPVAPFLRFIRRRLPLRPLLRFFL